MAQLTELHKKIEAMRRLPHGWDYGRGSPAPAKVVANAMLIAKLLQLAGADDLEALPGEDGAINTIGYFGDYSIEVQCFPNATFDFLYFSDDEAGEVVENLSFGDVLNKLGERGWLSHRLFVSCTRNVMSRKSDDSIGSLFGILPAAEFRSFAVSASRRREIPSAPIFVNTTAQTSVANPLSSGEYRLVNLQRVAA